MAGKDLAALPRELIKKWRTPQRYIDTSENREYFQGFEAGYAKCATDLEFVLASVEATPEEVRPSDSARHETRDGLAIDEKRSPDGDGPVRESHDVGGATAPTEPTMPLETARMSSGYSRRAETDSLGKRPLPTLNEPTSGAGLEPAASQLNTSHADLVRRLREQVRWLPFGDAYHPSVIAQLCTLLREAATALEQEHE